MLKLSKSRLFIFSIVLVFIAVSVASEEKKEEPAKVQKFLKGFFAVVKTMPDGVLIAASSAVGAPAYHRHLVRPGSATTYMLRLFNKESNAVTVNLELSGALEGWDASVAETSVKLDPNSTRYVMLTLKPSNAVPVGSVAAVKVRAIAGAKSEEISLEAETTAKRKIYYVSIDSLGTEYLKLNAKGAGPGKDGDWLMPNLHALIQDGTFYPQHKAHLIAATDMNHGSFLSGAYPGRLGLYSVQIYQFGFDKKGKPIAKTTPLDIMYYGKDGKPVTTIFNVVKDPAYGGNPNAFSAYISGKAWVPEHYRNPLFGLNRIVTTDDRPDYVTPCSEGHLKVGVAKGVIKMHMHKIHNPNMYIWEDIYTADQAIEVINNEDPDVAYILLGAVDMAGHTYGSGKDPSEWNPKKTPDDLSDDISKINSHANREGIIKTVKSADEQLGRLVEFLKKRGAFDSSYLVVESDHNMETNFFAGPPLHKILKKTGYSPKKDYFLFTASQIGVLFLRHDDPKMVSVLEKAMEGYTMKNPLTGEEDHPVIVLTRKEMLTGIDEATGKQITPPGQLYSEYYIEHPKPGGLRYPDMFMFVKQYYQFPLSGAGLGNIGLGVLPFHVPHVNIFIGGHGSISTQPALLMMHGPNVPRGLTPDSQTYSTDVAPTLYRLEGYKVPESVQGKGLPKIDPTLP